jgi:YbgC/YbaW family acyl-CoA thioester hydrolase
MSKTVVYDVQVVFGDCDPAGIVFFPNFSKWMDASSLNFFMKCGIPPWRELVKTRGIIGTPLLEINTKFIRPATYGETIQVHTSVQEWREKVFVHRHRSARFLHQAPRRSGPHQSDSGARRHQGPLQLKAGIKPCTTNPASPLMACRTTLSSRA